MAPKNVTARKRQSNANAMAKAKAKARAKAKANANANALLPVARDEAMRQLRAASPSEFPFIDANGNEIGDEGPVIRQQLLDHYGNTAKDLDGDEISPPLSKQEQRELLDIAHWQWSHSRERAAVGRKTGEQTGGRRRPGKKQAALMALNSQAASALANWLGLPAPRARGRVAAARNYLVDGPLSGKVHRDASDGRVKRWLRECDQLRAGRRQATLHR
jgi:hypothetical protein